MRGKLKHLGGNAEIAGDDGVRYVVADREEVVACKPLNGKWVDFEGDKTAKKPRAKSVRLSADQSEPRRERPMTDGRDRRPPRDGQRRQGWQRDQGGGRKPNGDVPPPDETTPVSPKAPRDFVWTKDADGFANPYNFVSFPSTAPDRQPPDHTHERFAGISGRLEVTLTNRSPLFVPGSVLHRGPWSAEEAAKYKSGNSGSAELLKEQDKTVRYLAFFTDAEGRPALPGSSLKGVVRSVAETLSNSCFSQLDELRVPFSERPFGHTEYYQKGKAPDKRYPKGRPHMGFYERTQRYWRRQINDRFAGVLRKDDQGQWYVQMGRFDKAAKVPDRVLSGVHDSHREHRKELWAELATDRNGRPVARRLSTAPGPGLTKVLLKVVEVPQDGNKANQHAIVLPLQCQHYPVQTGNCEHSGKEQGKTDLAGCRLCQANQAHEWQIAEDNAGSPSLTTSIAKSRRCKRHPLRAGDIVIFLADSSGDVVNLGPVELYRVLHEQAPADLFPPAYRPCHDARSLCPACRLFGMVAGERKEGGQALAGKVAFSGGRLTGLPQGHSEPAFMNGGKLVYLQPLGKPRPSCQQFYLKGSGQGEGRIHGYSAVPDVVLGELRGRKFYWHHRQEDPAYWKCPEAYDVEHPFLRPETDDAQGKSRIDGQSPYVQPLLPGHTFTFTITFDNLTPAELGLLLAALQPNLLPGQQQRKLWHKLGMAKPLGFGSVEVRVTSITLIDRKARYASAFATGHYAPADQEEALRGALQTVGLGETQRELLDIMDWDEAPAVVSYPFADPKCREKSFAWFTANKTVPLPTIPQTIKEKWRLRYGNWREKYEGWK